MRKRNLKSFYYDKYTGIVEQASKMPSMPFHRPRRYFLLIKASSRPSEKTIKTILCNSGIGLKKYLNNVPKDLPF